MQRSTMLMLHCAAAGVFALPLNAQSPTGGSIADSAAVARQAWGRGMRALNAKDLVTARAEIQHAALAWPTQPAYLWGRAYVAALSHDTSDVIASLDRYAGYGLGKSLADSAFLPYRGLAKFERVAAKIESNLKSAPRSAVVATLADSTFWPEGVDFDPRTRRFYVASVRHRTIAEVDGQGLARELWPRETPGIGAVLGVRVDTARGVLWATTSGIRQMEGFTPADSGIAALLRVRIADGTIERRWDLPPSPRGHVLGDLGVGPRGDVWLTDSNEPFLYVLRAGADTLERIASPLFRSLQGVAPTRDGRSVFIADYSHGLLVLDVASGAVTRLEDAPGSTSLGCDGIVLDPHGAIIAVQNGVAPARVMRFVIDSARRRMTKATLLDRNLAVADEPTIGAIAGDRYVYVANSQWEKYDDDGARKPAVALTSPVLLAIPLR